MSLPKYDKTQRKQNYAQLPKAAYVVKILNAKEEAWKSGGGSSLVMAIDIAEGEYAGYFSKQFENDTREDKKWPNDGVFRLSVPTDSSESYTWQNWNSFFADLEDSNSGFVFDGNVSRLKGKLIGGKFHIEQSEYNGTVYDHTRMKWTCVAEDVRKGKAGRLPNDKLITATRTTTPATVSTDFMNVPDNEPEIPF